jgi:hypothetical protein
MLLEPGRQAAGLGSTGRRGLNGFCQSIGIHHQRVSIQFQEDAAGRKRRTFVPVDKGMIFQESGKKGCGFELESLVEVPASKGLTDTRDGGFQKPQISQSMRAAGFIDHSAMDKQNVFDRQ